MPPFSHYGGEGFFFCTYRVRVQMADGGMAATYWIVAKFFRLATVLVANDTLSEISTLNNKYFA